MKRLLTILAFLLLASPALAFDGACRDGEPWQLARMNLAVLGSGSAVSPCPSGSTYLSAWNGDYTAQTKYLCYNSKASTKDGSEVGTVEITSDYGRTGIGLQKTAENEGIKWLISSQDILDDSVGTICVDIYVDSDTVNAATQIVEFTADSSPASDKVYCGIQTTAVVRCYYLGDTDSESCNTTATVPARTWTTIKYTWDVTGQRHKVCVDASCGSDGNTDSLTILNPRATNVILGEYYTNAGTGLTLRYDNMYIYSTYDATCGN